MPLKKSWEVGIPIYADWRGFLVKKLGLVRGTPNVLIVDREVGPIQNGKLNRFYSILDASTDDT